MDMLLQAIMWGIAPNDVLQTINSDMSMALIDAIELMPAVDRRNVYVAHIFEPKQGDYPYRVGYEQDGKKEWWAGESLNIAVEHLREAMSPPGRLYRQMQKIPMPGEVN